MSQRLELLQKQMSSFQYTVDGGILTKEERQFYEENGFLVVRQMFTPEEIKEWTQRFREYADGQLERKYGMQVVRDISLVKRGGGKQWGEEAITKIQDWQEDEILFKFCRNPKVIQYLKSFCGPDIKSVHTMFINKPPNMGKTSRHPIHQDQVYFPFGPADRIAAGWAALEDANRENGCLVVYPGTHKVGPVEHCYPDWKEGVNKAYWGVKDMPPESAPKIHLEMKAGDIVFFHPYLFHGSGENRSSSFRKSICCHFASANCQYHDIKGTFHENLAKDIIAYASKKFGHVNYLDIWRFKCRLVQGNPDPLGL
ncbi:unnamed protein product [Paramecium primaurelia]|uniref:Phytanoyl-CoA dioxygenase n=1 Tax=Paramecium primaurelia TaxID=5886 RepID=A0A8S1PL87_PARPR|nr:unnamed protein product [Paramecium primaurelia]